MISKYDDFILENKLELLLEVKLELTSNFRKALDSMSDNKIAKFILSLNDKDIEDLDRNLIDITDYEDKVSFIAQNRYDSTRFYKMIDSGDVYSGLVIKLNDLKYSKYPYIDTFKNYYYEENILTNFYINKPMANELGIKSTWCYTLEYTDGSNRDEDEECNRCHGSGESRCTECDGQGCDECDGVGFIDCPECQ